MGGRAAEALARYARARERLADELGTDPSPQTVALYTAILRGELVVPARPAPPANGAAGLVGRDGELAYLETIASRGGVEVAVVDGEGGIGKTTLLRAWAERRAAAGDTVLLASCGPLDRSLPVDAPLLGVASAPRPPPMLADSMLGPAVLYAALVRALGRLAGRAPLTIVLDDAHLAGPALADWLRFLRRQQAAGHATEPAAGSAGQVTMVIVAAVRPGEGEPLPATASIHLDALGRDAAAELEIG